MIADALKRLTQHSAIYALGPAVHKAIGFVLLPVVTAYIGSTGNYGVTEMAGVTIAVAAQVLGINLLHGMTRFYKEYETEAERRALVSTCLVLLVATTSTAFVLAWAFAEEGAELLFDSREYAPALVLTAGILVAQVVSQVGLRWLQILEKSITYGVITTLKLLLEVGFKIWFLVGLGLAYMGVLYSVLVGELVVAVAIGGVLVVRSGLVFSREAARRLVRYSAPLLLSGLCMFVLHQGDRFFVLRLEGEAQVGLYGLCYKLGAIGNTVLFDAFGLIWFPLVFGVRDAAQRERLVSIVMIAFNVVMCSVSLALALFSAEITRLMAAPAFYEAHHAIPIVVAGYVFWTVFQLASTELYVRERTGVVSLLVAGAAVLNVALNALLVPWLGYAGAAWATLATFGALALATWTCVARITGARYDATRVLVPIGLATALFCAGRALPEGVSALAIACKLALVLALPGILWTSGFLKREEKDKIKASWGKRARR
jgi:O-antigen/teichoic acid export membrane protein